MDFDQLNARLPEGTSDFKDIISSNCVYVDKTQYIYGLALKKGQYFLSRPRRFGKSTLISTFEELFSHGVKPYDGHESYFKGLYIEDKWTDEKEYLIMRLDFAELFSDYCNTGNDFEIRFIQVLNEFSEQFGIAPKEEDLLESYGYIPITLGNRIMRVETAAIYIASIINFCNQN